ncbi:hypothetical protein AGMMS49953_05530 [Endomicrobiia bacterium]|nr:hypothetical protein AGMMS49953_05530 [Endomicrobiia bacterium]
MQGKDLYTNEAIAALEVKCDKILKEYLYYYLSVFDWDSLVAGDIKVKGKTLNKKKLNEINIYYPIDISEQKKIVARLDKLSAETKKLEIVYQKKIDGLAELKKSVFKQTFDCG